MTEKFSRGFDHLIYIWGVDHHGTVARNKNAAQAMGYDPDHYQVLLIGWVRFVVDGDEVSMSKRAGTFVTLDDLLDAVGTDAARWFFASRAAHVEIDFDIEQAQEAVRGEPRLLRPVRARAYRVDPAQGRGGRARAGGRRGGAPGRRARGGPGPGRLAAPRGRGGRRPAPRRRRAITAYATELATQFHAFYRDARVVDPDAARAVRQALALALATQTTLANALGLLGISAPDAM